MHHVNTKESIYLVSKGYEGPCDIIVKIGWPSNNRYCLCLLYVCSFISFYLCLALELKLL
jgi:hypothetical protein